MDRFTCVLIVILTLISINGYVIAENTDLIGVWKGTAVGYEENAGFTDFGEDVFIMNITEQKDRIFSGYLLTQDLAGSNIKKSIVGVFSNDGTEIYLAEHGQGLSMGKILGPDEFELIYLDSGNITFAAIDHFIRT